MHTEATDAHIALRSVPNPSCWAKCISLRTCRCSTPILRQTCIRNANEPFTSSITGTPRGLCVVVAAAVAAATAAADVDVDAVDAIAVAVAAIAAAADADATAFAATADAAAADAADAAAAVAATVVVVVVCCARLQAVHERTLTACAAEWFGS